MTARLEQETVIYLRGVRKPHRQIFPVVFAKMDNTILNIQYIEHHEINFQLSILVRSGTDSLSSTWAQAAISVSSHRDTWYLTF